MAEWNQRHEWESKAEFSSQNVSSKFVPLRTHAEPSGTRPAMARSCSTTLDVRLEQTPCAEGLKTRRFAANACPAVIPSSPTLTVAAVSPQPDSVRPSSNQETCSEESQRFLSSLWLCLHKDPQQAFSLIGGMVILIQHHNRLGHLFPLDHCLMAELEEYGKFVVLPPEEFLSPTDPEHVTRANLLFLLKLLEHWVAEIECSQLSKCEIEELVREPFQLLSQGHEKALRMMAGVMWRATR